MKKLSCHNGRGSEKEEKANEEERKQHFNYSSGIQTSGNWCIQKSLLLADVVEIHQGNSHENIGIRYTWSSREALVRVEKLILIQSRRNHYLPPLHTYFYTNRSTVSAISSSFRLKAARRRRRRAPTLAMHTYKAFVKRQVRLFAGH